MELDLIHVDELLCYFGNGATNPLHGVINNTRYIVKLFNNCEGNKTLVNELVCYLIAKKLELPIPDAVLGIVDMNTKFEPSIFSSEDFNDSCYGIAFCSKLIYPVSTISSKKMLLKAPNHNWLIPKLMLFDHIIYNKDRNKGNLLMSLSKQDSNLYIIDHSHTFNMEALWNSHGLNQRINESDYNDSTIMEDNWYHYSKFKECINIDMIEMQQTVQYFKDRLNSEFLQKIIDQIPIEWENDKEELKSLIGYIIYRIEHIDTYADLIINTKY